jgi:hypothetical protein
LDDETVDVEAVAPEVTVRDGMGPHRCCPRRWPWFAEYPAVAAGCRPKVKIVAFEFLNPGRVGGHSNRDYGGGPKHDCRGRRLEDPVDHLGAFFLLDAGRFALWPFHLSAAACCAISLRRSGESTSMRLLTIAIAAAFFFAMMLTVAQPVSSHIFPGASRLTCSRVYVNMDSSVMLTSAYQIAVGLIYKREKLVRDPLYKRWIKRFACVGCGRTWGIDPAHTGAHGYGIKSSDLSCIPLCRKCHDEFDANPSDFAIVHKLDIPVLTAYFNNAWSSKQKRTA